MSCSRIRREARAAGTDDARDGKHSAFATFTVSAAAVTVGKTAVVYSDPFNGAGGNPKAIPGAVITYTVTVTNAAGGSQATNVSITDNLSVPRSQPARSRLRHSSPTAEMPVARARVSS